MVGAVNLSHAATSKSFDNLVFAKFPLIHRTVNRPFALDIGNERKVYTR